jgi:hypothetical protein
MANGSSVTPLPVTTTGAVLKIYNRGPNQAYYTLGTSGALDNARSLLDQERFVVVNGKLEKAAKELEKLDEVKLTPKENKALEEKLKQLAKQMGDAGQGALGDAVSELADGLMQWPETRSLIEARMGPTALAVAERNAEDLGRKLEGLGMELRNGEAPKLAKPDA